MLHIDTKEAERAGRCGFMGKCLLSRRETPDSVGKWKKRIDTSTMKARDGDVRLPWKNPGEA